MDPDLEQGCFSGLKDAGEGTQTRVMGTEPEAYAPGPVSLSPLASGGARREYRCPWGSSQEPDAYGEGQLGGARPLVELAAPLAALPCRDMLCQPSQLLDLNQLPVASRLALGLW